MFVIFHISHPNPHALFFIEWEVAVVEKWIPSYFVQRWINQRDIYIFRSDLFLLFSLKLQESASIQYFWNSWSYLDVDERGENKDRGQYPPLFETGPYMHNKVQLIIALLFVVVLVVLFSFSMMKDKSVKLRPFKLSLRWIVF